MNKKVDLQNGEEISIKDQRDAKLTCGIIMPIATMSSEYTSEHWSDVRHILHKAIEKAGFIPRIVSDSEESTVIHGSIINNIHNDAIIVCDVSNKNANVMFELGMRLAFNKPVVIVKDDKTDYSFDTGNIQHEPYRKDLRHSTVEKFIDDLSKKISKTYEASQKDDYQSFLSYFGKFEVAKIENKSIAESEALEKLLNKMGSIESQMKYFVQNEHALNYKDLDNNLSNVITVNYHMFEQEDAKKAIMIIREKISSVESISYDLKLNEFKFYFDSLLDSKLRKKYEVIIKDILSECDSLPF